MPVLPDLENRPIPQAQSELMNFQTYSKRENKSGNRIVMAKEQIKDLKKAGVTPEEFKNYLAVKYVQESQRES